MIHSDFTGRFCEHPVKLCEEAGYCLNNGICLVLEEIIETNSSQFKYDKNVCFCRPSFYGDRCEFNYSRCLSTRSLCENNGTCLNGKTSNDSFECICSSNFRGKYCEINCELTGDCSSNNQIELTPSISTFLNTLEHHLSSLSTDQFIFTSINPNDQIEKTIIHLSPSLSSQIYPTSTFQETDLSNNFSSFTQSTPIDSFFNVTEQKKNKFINDSYPIKTLSSSTSINRSKKDQHIFSPKFNGLDVNTSFLQFEKDRHEFATSFNVHFDFKTNQSTGVLFHSEAESNPIVFTIIYLEDGLLKLSFSCNQESTIFLISDKHIILNQNQINHVEMYFRFDQRKFICESQIQLNNSLSIRKNQSINLPSFNSSHLMSDDEKKMNRICFKYFNFGSSGGQLINGQQYRNPYLPDKIGNFRGCLRNIHINNSPKLIKDALRADFLDECDSGKICDLKPCGRHGNCLIIDKDIHKTNQTNYNAFDDFNRFNAIINRNEQISPTSPTSTTSTNHQSIDWRCQCSNGYFGDFCENANCDQNPCSNHSICLIVSKSELNCVCPVFKFGDYCELG